MTMLELAERCEARSADEWPLIREAGLRVFGPGHKEFRRIQRLCDEKAFLDAAMALVPEGCGFLLTSTHSECWAQIVGQSTLADGTKLSGPGLASSKAATPALALTAACLRARATLPEGEER